MAKKHRAKWNALESLNVFSWSGSALLGGILIDEFGYQKTFLITATLQGISALCLLPLLVLVQAETGAHSYRDWGGTGTGTGAGQNLPVPPVRVATLREGLLASDADEASRVGSTNRAPGPP